MAVMILGIEVDLGRVPILAKDGQTDLVQITEIPLLIKRGEIFVLRVGKEVALDPETNIILSRENQGAQIVSLITGE